MSPFHPQDQHHAQGFEGENAGDMCQVQDDIIQTMDLRRIKWLEKLSFNTPTPTADAMDAATTCTAQTNFIDGVLNLKAIFSLIATTLLMKEMIYVTDWYSFY